LGQNYVFQKAMSNAGLDPKSVKMMKYADVAGQTTQALRELFPDKPL